jgi:hypothetical protein
MDEAKTELTKTQNILKKEELLSEGKEVIFAGADMKTPHDHANRILGYGEKRARMLLNMHKYGTSWSHVDWKEVESGLSAI